MVIWAVAAVLATLAAARLFGGGGDDPERISIDGGTGVEEGRTAGSGYGAGPGLSGAAGGASAGEKAVYVHVAGEVRRPGLYRVDAAARVARALERAGGPRPRAELAAVNLAAHVVDGQQIVVPKVGAVAPGGAGAAGGATGATAGAGGAKLSLAAATLEQLDQLDGIGPTLAQRIVEYRDSHGGFRSLAELGEVDGIGEKRLASLREALDP
jgi:competence protein ComEA